MRCPLADAVMLVISRPRGTPPHAAQVCPSVLVEMPPTLPANMCWPLADMATAPQPRLPRQLTEAHDVPPSWLKNRQGSVDALASRRMPSPDEAREFQPAPSAAGLTVWRRSVQVAP